MLSHDDFRALLNGLPLPVLAVDGRDVLIHINQAGEQALGVRRSDIAGLPLGTFPALRDLFAQAERPGAASGTLTHLRDGSRWLALAPAAPPPPPTLASERIKQGIHALKTPLAVAKSALDLLEECGDVSAEQRGLMARAQDNIAQMRATIDKLLYVSWLESSGALQRAPVDLAALLKRQAAELDAGARAQGITLKLALDGPCVVDGDAAQLDEAIGNLLSNAIKYSPGGGAVTIAVQQHGDQAALRITDEGIGIAPEHLPHLFDEFYRVQTPDTRRIKGSGLGLSIVKTIVERHGGTLQVESQPRAGSTFTVRLPLHSGT